MANKALPPAKLCKAPGSPVSGSTPLKFQVQAAIPQDKLFVAESVTAAAVLAERERCAKIAESAGVWCLPEFAYDFGFQAACNEIADAIRRGK